MTSTSILCALENPDGFIEASEGNGPDPKIRPLQEDVLNEVQLRMIVYPRSFYFKP
jgi:hypothetical protein